MTDVTPAVARRELAPSSRSPLATLLWLALAVVAVAVLARGSAWLDWCEVGSSLDPESSHIFLVVPFAAAIVYANRSKLAAVRWQPSWLGPAVIVAGYAIARFGYFNQKQSAFHCGSVVMAIGAVVSVLGHDVVRKFWPAFLLLGFMVPVPNMVRLQVATPLQSTTAAVVAPILEFFGEPVGRQGNSLTVNGKQVLIVEACNGLRMVWTLILVCWLFAFITPLRNWVRWLVILISPGVALVCNVVRLIPTLWMYGHSSKENAEKFHDYAGWGMLFVAFMLLMFVIKFIEACGVEVRAEEKDEGSAKDEGGRMKDEGGAPALRPMPLNLIRFLPVAVAVVILGCVLGFAPLPVVKVGVNEFHERSRAAVEALPLKVGTWAGVRQEMEVRERELLQPNAERTIKYTDAHSERQAYLAVVQVPDARLMAGHAPSNCYPGAGWTIESVEARKLTVGGTDFAPLAYSMNRQTPQGAQRWVVYDFFIFPDGRDGTTLAEIDRFAQDYRKLKYGICHVQVVTWDPRMTTQERDQVFSTLVGSERFRDMVRVMRTGMPR
ncbi:MAG TPA: exosortase/archaeosortase family protein [Tepidisphaeraceae bacterium]|nr:exosortase/archaeosortase family protein [Tepidisphaeraceae bacterium]